MYSEKVRQLILDLPHRGTLEDATHESLVENPICGDVIHLYLHVHNNIVIASRFQSRGCPGALAASAGLAQLVENRSVRECLQVSLEDLLAHLDGLPAHKKHGAELALQALHSALGS